MSDSQFLTQIKKSFIKFLETNSRSNKKLKILHGFIASDLAQRLGEEYQIKSFGWGSQKEGKISGRYIDKKVDISVYDKQGRAIAGIGVKFVMQNYAQNSNNYFENMLGETANIQCQNIPYFQVFIVPESLPYYDKKRVIKKWEKFNSHHASKYVKLSQDNSDILVHSPAKTLFYIIDLPQGKFLSQNQEQYRQYYLNQDFEIKPSNSLNDINFENGVILNNYSLFMDKIVHRILSV